MRQLKQWKEQSKYFAEQLANRIFATLSLLMCLYYADLPVPKFHEFCYQTISADLRTEHTRCMPAPDQLLQRFRKSYNELIDAN